MSTVQRSAVFDGHISAREGPERKRTCLYCLASFSGNTSTGILKKHLSICTKVPDEVREKFMQRNVEKDTFQPKVTDFAAFSHPMSEMKKKESNSVLLEYFMAMAIPLSHVGAAALCVRLFF